MHSVVFKNPYWWLEVDTEATMLSWLVVKLFGLGTLSTNFAKCG